MVTSGVGRAQKFSIPRPPRGNSHTLSPFSLPKVANTQIQSFFLQESFSQSSSFKKSVLSLSKRSPPHTLLLPSGAAPPRTILLPASASPLTQLLCRGWGRPPRRRNGGLLPRRSSTEVRMRRTAMKKSRTSSGTSA
jgi:hypothetical protein